MPRVMQVARRAALKVNLAGTASDAQREWLRLYFATNRRATGQAETAQAFDSQRSDELSHGAIEVSVRRQDGMRQIDNPALLRFERTTSTSDVAVAGHLQVLKRKDWLAEVGQRATRMEKPGVLLFIHGYNVGFVDAARRAGQLSYDLGFPGPTVFMAWPSEASVSGYLKDGLSAENSWSAAAQLLDEITSLNEDGPVYIVAHSMGNRVMLGGLSKLLAADPGRRRAIKSVVMAAPDIDQDTFRLNWANQLLNLGIGFTLYASDRDLAMTFSETVQGGKRMGNGGASLLKIKGVDSVDVSAVTREFFALNHSYFGDQATVLSDLFFLLRQGLPAEQRPRLRRIEPKSASAWILQ